MDLPNNEVEWRLLLKSEQIEHVSIHDGLHTNSASGIALKQFLLLRVLCKDARKLDPSKWLDGECLETARSRLRNGETGWGSYLDSIQNSKSRFDHNGQFRSLGTFSLVRQYQIALSEVDTQPISSARPKLEFSPIKTRGQRAAEAAQEAARVTAKPPQTPTRPPRYPVLGNQFESPGLAAVDDELRNLDLTDDSGLSSSVITPSTAQTIHTVQLSPYSPATGNAASFPTVKDEQIFNMALIVLLDALIIHFNEIKGGWSPHRHPFTVRNQTGDKVYEARVDGYLRSYKGDDVRAIVEVKPFSRYIGTSTVVANAVGMQEAAQMTAWICQYPPKNIDEFRREKKSMT
jgi:hypothetical protein